MRIQKFATDVQLINVGNKGDVHNMADFPYGMSLITAYIRKQGINTLLLQYPLQKKEAYLKKVLDNPAYLYGFQVGFENYADIKELVTIIKKNNPEGKIIYGGPFVISLYEDLLKNDQELDAVILGEGEYTVCELIKILKDNSQDWRLIHGIAWLDEDNKVVVNSHRPAIQDLDAMPFASRDGISEEAYDHEGKYMHDVRITTSRGCTSNCTFCAVNASSKWQKSKRWRGRNPICVVDEIQELVEKYNVKLINLQDSAFDDPGRLGPKRNKIFCEEILKRNIEISMKAYFRAHSIKDDIESIELYKLYKEAGIDVIIIGAEAGSDHELEIYGKDANLEDNYRSFKVMNDLDLFFVHSGFIMYGPYSTLSTIRDNLQFLWDNQLYFWYHNIDSTLLLTPGAAIYDNVKNEGRVHHKNNFWEIPDYEFTSPLVLKLVLHYQRLREIYPHIDVGSPLVLTVSNIITRLKNKMNKKVAIACKKEIDEFGNVFYQRKRELNELGYRGAMENLNRIEKDGLKADLLKASEPYFGQNMGIVVYAIKDAYQTLIDAIVAKGFGLGGLIFKAEFTSRESRTDTLEGMKSTQLKKSRDF